MDLYILDDYLNKVEVVDFYESLIWTERFSSYGDFELVIPYTNKARSLLTVNTKLTMSESDSVMIVDSIFNENRDGTNVLKITGKSIESLLKDRLARNTYDTITTFPTWDLVGYPEQICYNVVNAICYAGALTSNDNIPYLQATGAISSVTPPPPGVVDGTLFGTINTYSEQVSVKAKLASVYDLVTSLADSYGFGFRFYKLSDLAKLFFIVYTGNDRTTSQTSLPSVIFGPNFDNMHNTSELTSYSDYKNVAIVFSQNSTQTVYGIGVDPTVSGYERRVMFVDASDISLATGPSLVQALTARGLEALGQQKPLFAFDGEISQLSSYKYRIDYYLGDLVEFQNIDGVTNIMKVTEQIFVSDSQGIRSYPTLSTQSTVTPGSWYSLGIEEWDTTTGVWNDF